MLRYAVIGSGYRAEYFGRIARTYPDLFQAVYVCRSPEKASLMHAHTGAKAVVSGEALPFRPDFAIIAVDRSHVADVAFEWLDRGIPVVTETPIGDTQEKLDNLWQRHKQGKIIVCCEQYHRYPILAAGLNAVHTGRIGTPTSIYISLLHDYHAASMIRKCLKIQPGEPFVMHGIRQLNSVAESDSRSCAILDGRIRESERDMVHISFASGKEAIYDFAPVQYRSFIRSRHLTVRGTRGEWSDTRVLCLDEHNCPERISLTPEIPERYRSLDTQTLRDKRRTWCAELAPDTAEDEFAIATILLDMADCLAGGPSPYPLSDALEDAYFWLCIQESVKSPFTEIRSSQMLWHRP